MSYKAKNWRGKSRIGAYIRGELKLEDFIPPSRHFKQKFKTHSFYVFSNTLNCEKPLNNVNLHTSQTRSKKSERHTKFINFVNCKNLHSSLPLNSAHNVTTEKLKTNQRKKQEHFIEWQQQNNLSDVNNDRVRQATFCFGDSKVHECYTLFIKAKQFNDTDSAPTSFNDRQTTKQINAETSNQQLIQSNSHLMDAIENKTTEINMLKEKIINLQKIIIDNQKSNNAVTENHSSDSGKTDKIIQTTRTATVSENLRENNANSADVINQLQGQIRILQKECELCRAKNELYKKRNETMVKQLKTLQRKQTRTYSFVNKLLSQLYRVDGVNMKIIDTHKLKQRVAAKTPLENLEEIAYLRRILKIICISLKKIQTYHYCKAPSNYTSDEESTAKINDECLLETLKRNNQNANQRIKELTERNKILTQKVISLDDENSVLMGKLKYYPEKIEFNNIKLANRIDQLQHKISRLKNQTQHHDFSDVTTLTHFN